MIAVSSPLADLLGWLLAFLLPAFALAGPLRRDRGATHAYLFAAFLHVAAAAVYIHFPGILPTRGDAHAFHASALKQHSMAEWSVGIGSQLYKYYLTYVYSLAGPSFFLGAVLSIYAFAFSVLVLVKFMDLLAIRRGRGLTVLLFGALPTAVLYGAVPLREPYQVLFFMLACYGMLRFRLTNRPIHLITAIAFALLMGLLHKGLIMYAPLLIMIMLFMRVDHGPLYPRSGIRSTYLHRFLAGFLAVGIFAATPFIVQNLDDVHGVEVLKGVTDGGLIEYVEGHRDEEALTKGRTAYGVALDSSSIPSFLYTLSLILFYYLLAPFPWQIENLADIYAFGEVFLRIICIIAIFRMWRQGDQFLCCITIMFITVYISMALIWASGTTNYGTATRHNMVHQWILLLLGVPTLIQMVSVSRRGHHEDQGAEVSGRSEQRDTNLRPINPYFVTFNQSYSRPSRLDAGYRQTKRLQMANTALGILPGGLRRVRRLT